MKAKPCIVTEGSDYLMKVLNVIQAMKRFGNGLKMIMNRRERKFLTS
jgi:hypothetical protein